MGTYTHILHLYTYMAGTKAYPFRGPQGKCEAKPMKRPAGYLNRHALHVCLYSAAGYDCSPGQSRRISEARL